MQDPSSNAMTEVALGLSMAFFALLILALISIGVKPSMTTKEGSSIDTLALEFTQQIQEEKKTKESVIYFYLNAEFYDLEGQWVNSHTVMQAEKIIIALSPELSVVELDRLQKRLSTSNHEFTVMSQDWRDFFANKGII